MKKNWENKLKEQLAEIEHQRWADWQKWCHHALRENCPSPELEKVLKRWDKLIATKYQDLTEKEKNSDREQVDRYFPLIIELFEEEKQKLIEEIIKIIEKDYSFTLDLRTKKAENNWGEIKLKLKMSIKRIK